ncbi:hypothetical protein QYF36_017725 [Acer negundo]|nr:hypothetical protein QYF36_017725 [Acer negundo]
MAQLTRSTGKVTWFDDVKGYGFIKPDDGGADLFVHQKSIKSDGYRTLYENQSVEFDVQLEPGSKYQALDVTAPGGNPIQSPKKESGFNGGRRGGGGGFGGNWKGVNEGRRNNGGGAGYGSAGVVCYNCDGVGHVARECTSNRRTSSYNGGGGGGGGGSGCYNCGDLEHFARDCPRQQGINSNGGGVGGGNCFKCGGFGHRARECTNRASSGGGGRGFGGGGCYSCGKSGHLARDCTEGSGGGGSGAGLARFGGGGAGGTTCFNCGKPGHFARECTKVFVSPGMPQILFSCSTSQSSCNNITIKKQFRLMETIGLIEKEMIV